MKPLRIFAVIFLILWTAALYLHFQSILYPPQDVTIDWRLMKQVVPGSTAFRRAKPDAPVYEALGPFEDVVGYAFYTRDFVKHINGYGGPIEMVIGIDPQGTITGIKITRQRETPAFIQNLSAFTSQIIGKNIHTPLILGKNIDGITSATITSSAVVSTINTAAQRITANTGMPAAPKGLNRLPQIIQTGLRLCIGLLLLLLSAWASTTRKKIARWTALVSGFLFLGIFSQEMLSTSHVAGMVLLQTPGGNQSLWLILLTAAIITCLIFGRSYCVGVCPFGFVEELLFTLNRRIFHKTMSPNKKTDHRCRWIKYFIFTLILATCVYDQKSALGSAEVYITLFTGKGHLLSWILLTWVLFGSFFFLRFWCRYLCPFGAFLGLLSQFRIQRHKTHSTLAQITPVTLCAMPSECFYCDRCSKGEFNKSAPIHNKFFLILILAAGLLFAGSFGKTIYDEYRSRLSDYSSHPEDQSPRPAEKNLAAARIETYSTSSEGAEKKLQEAGITPHPAKYWGVKNNDSKGSM